MTEKLVAHVAAQKAELVERLDRIAKDVGAIERLLADADLATIAPETPPSA